MDNDLQRIDLKVFLDAPEGARFDSLLTAFDRWRKETDAPSDWVDLADYAHMKQGPAILMAGKRDRLALDTNEPGPGILVQTQRDLTGDLKERFLLAFRRHLALATRLVGEAEWPSSLAVRGGDWTVTINDRLGFPNNDQTDQAVRTDLTAALDTLFGEAGYNLTRNTNPEDRFEYRVEAEGNPTLTELKAKLG